MLTLTSFGPQHVRSVTAQKLTNQTFSGFPTAPLPRIFGARAFPLGYTSIDAVIIIMLLDP